MLASGLPVLPLVPYGRAPNGTTPHRPSPRPSLYDIWCVPRPVACHRGASRPLFLCSGNLLSAVAMAADELELTTDCLSYDVATLYASSFAGLMGGVVRHYLREPARIGAYLETLPSYARPDKRAAACQSRYGPSSGSRTRSGARQAVSRWERRLLKGAGQGVLTSLNMNAYPALLVATNRMTPCTLRV